MKPRQTVQLIQQDTVTGAVGQVPVLDRLGNRLSAPLAVNFLRSGCAGVQCILDWKELGEFEKILFCLQLPDEQFTLVPQRDRAADWDYAQVLITRATVPPLPTT